MRGYILNFIGVALCVGLLEELLPGQSGSKQFVRFLTGLCLLAVMIAPLGKWLATLPDSFSTIVGEEADEAEEKYTEILAGELRDTVRENLIAVLKEDLAKEFSVDPEKSDVGILFAQEDSIRVTCVIVTLRGKDILKNPREMEAYFGKLLDCECRVICG